MEPIGAYEAKTHLPQLLERVAAGEKFLITKHGLPVAVLQSPAPQRKSDPREIIADSENSVKKTGFGAFHFVP